MATHCWLNAYFAKVVSTVCERPTSVSLNPSTTDWRVRARENRTHGPEGGETGTTGLPYPYRDRTVRRKLEFKLPVLAHPKDLGEFANR